ncbi:hypothetical protein [Nostoc sp. UHCC 0870]|uniref:hypothetical protein n=1 Tax=Nostoc sp. UHCC 0870 TaxID=2914041 RepID=UPI001EDCDB48|nr:hypothetical protein [Nostoc sp. UHCC 0870]UKO96839.1 hypothetical protein L6494_19825 [Nostoc sp. UHCC 0870]
MPITISQQAFWELFSETEEIQNQCADEFETICPYPQELGQGNLLYIHLREGLELTIADYLVVTKINLALLWLDSKLFVVAVLHQKNLMNG